MPSRHSVLACAALVVATLLVAAPGQASSGRTYTVTGVSDGDTIRVVVKGRTERVRLIGIDAPELAHDGAPAQCHARAATRQMRKLVKGKRVRLARDSSQANRDAYGRLLRYVYTAKGGRDVGRTLVAGGHGREYTFKGRRYQHRSSHLRAQRSAERAGRGLWGACGTPAPTSCAIKGNISYEGERIYHVPGQQYYDVTGIDTARGERWFCSESDAVAAGWRRSQV